MADEDGEGLRGRLSRQSEEALGKLATDLLENPLINSAITRAFSAREKAASAQEAAMGALNLPSAADIDRLTRRLRTVSNRLEGIEEAIDRLQEGVDRLSDRLETREPQLGSGRRRPRRRDRGPALQARQRGWTRLGRDRRAAGARPARAGAPGRRRRAAAEAEAKPARKRAAKKKAAS